MKTNQTRMRIKNPLALPVLLAGLGSVLGGHLTAQTFTTLHGFTGGSDGGEPQSGLILSGNTLYGTASTGGTYSNGTLFKVNTDGTGFSSLYSFTALDTSTSFTNNDGAKPIGGLILSSNTLYGTTSNGGSSGRGTLFAINTDGTGFTTLHSFTAGGTNSSGALTNSDGANPVGGLILSGNTLYGTASQGGNSGKGTVFAVNNDGTGFTNLHSFSAPSGPSGTNSDGISPYGGLILSGNTLCGTAFGGGSSGYGTVFSVNTDGTGFTTLHRFAGFPGDGAGPIAGLFLTNNALYGTTFNGGYYGWGTVFAINADGTGFRNLYSFTYIDMCHNTDGCLPVAGVILSGDTLYGTARDGGSPCNGTVFAVNTNGTGFVTLSGFPQTPGSSDGNGAAPMGGLVLSGNSLYGTLYVGGMGGDGTMFSLSFTPQLTVVPAGANVVLTWPTNFAGFDYTGYRLQSTTNLGSSALWTTNLPAPVVINGQNTVTNPTSGAQQFFRLSQ